ncbi:hypothetical protein F4810DRAFT_644135 [Camillea tinctor]|nr:hypothetical protein F4810DRAFT_644135 [Camillea tinctor]
MSRKSVMGSWSASHGACDIAKRSFTSTARRDARITKFTPTDSPALDELLNEIRYKIILPAHLPAYQRKKMYSPKFAKALQSDPITMEIDGETIKFRHVNLVGGGVPRASRSVIQAVSQFNTPKDFANFLPLIEGVKVDRKFDRNFYCALIRHLGEKGHISTMLECARRVEHTGYRLNESEKVTKLLYYIQKKAIDSDWDLQETRQALCWAEMVIEMLQDQEHLVHEKNSGEPVEGQIPLFRDPLVLLAPLHLAAALAKHEKAKDEVQDKIAKYAKSIIVAWPHDKGLKQLQPQQLFEKDRSMNYLTTPNQFLTLASPLLYGLGKAVEVAKPEQAAQLKLRHEMLAAEIQTARKENEKIRAAKTEAGKPMNPKYPDGKGRGEEIYQRLFGEQASI